MNNQRKHWIIGVMLGCLSWSIQAEIQSGIPTNLKIVLDNTQVLEQPRLERLPLYVWSIHGTLKNIPDSQSRHLLTDLDQRGIAYCVNWNHKDFEASLKEGLRIAKLQETLGMEVSVNANACLYALFDGTESTAHIDEGGNPFWDTSFGPKTGCPFALSHRVPVIRDQIARFVDAYQEKGVTIDFIFADWEIDGPMEWNEAWQHSQRCKVCKEQLPPQCDFRAFQTILRRLRSNLQNRMFSEPVLSKFPKARIGNYAVYPHDGFRYWYDYFEKLPEIAPVILDHQAKHREWAPEFDESGYTMSMPVVYTWHSIFDPLPFESNDYRWFYNMLKVASNAGAHTDPNIPSVPFVHWHTTAPPDPSSNELPQFREQAYQDLLWHMLLRGHDTFFLWCLEKELAKEVSLVQEVYAASMNYLEFMRHGTPIEQGVPGAPGTVISGLRLGSKVLVKRSDFADQSPSRTLSLSETESVVVPVHFDLGILPVTMTPKESLWHETNFPIGFYEHPKNDEDLRDMAAAGLNLVRCSNRTDLDRVEALGMKGWISLAVQDGLTEALQRQASAVWDHPALAVWEGPDEIVWTFTAYSFLKDRAGFTREDWNNQKPVAVNYAESVGKDLLPRMRQSIEWLNRNEPQGHPFWINEAADSDAEYARGYVDAIDIIGCDYYAVRTTGTDLQSIGRLVERWDAIGKGRPVWMVLQGFSWHTIRQDRDRLYPSFLQSRFMAYDAIVHGARGLLYWGTQTIDDPAFRQSLYALTSEISTIASFLKEDATTPIPTRIIPDLFEPPGQGVKALLCHQETESILILVNQDPHRHLGVEVMELKSLDGMRLHLLYGHEMKIPKSGSIITRMQANEVKVFATNPALAKGFQKGRDYVDKQE